MFGNIYKQGCLTFACMSDNAKEDIPNLGWVNEKTHSTQWKSKFGYNKRISADWLVIYNKSFELGNTVLIEASIKSLQRKMEQIREAHEFFVNVRPPDTLLIVLNKLSSRDDRKYKLKPYKNLRYLHYIHSRIGRDNKIKQINEKSGNKNLFVLKRSDFKNLAK